MKNKATKINVVYEPDLPLYAKVLQHHIKHFELKLDRLIKTDDVDDAVKLIKSAMEDRLNEAGIKHYFELSPDFQDQHKFANMLITSTYNLNKGFNECGKQHIKINKTAFSIIDNINIDKVDFEAIRQPFDTCAWIIDNLQKIATGHIYSSFSDNKTGLLLGLNLLNEQNNFLGQFITCAQVIEDAVNKIKHPFVSHNSKIFHDELTTISMFILKACVFIQAHPECLKNGPYVEDNKWITVKRGKKKTKRLQKGRKPSIQIIIPERYLQTKAAHFTRAHFRSLSNPRYRRVNESGELLEIGEAGHIRIISIDGHFKGGKLSHIKEL